MELKVKIKRLSPSARIPARGSSQAAGHDLYACLDTESVSILPHQTVRIGTGLAVEIPEGYFGGVFARSGLSAKSGLRPANCVGVIDSDYRGECMVPVHNDSDEIRQISNGERIAQLILLPYLAVSFEEAEELSETGRGEGGFGSTGRN